MTDKMRSFVEGLAMALCGRAVKFPTSEPVAFLYNGVRLPDIYSVYTPELQAKYPYAVLIQFNDSIYNYSLRCSASPFERTGRVLYPNKVLAPHIGCNAYTDRYDDFWESETDMEMAALYDIFWSNHDILNKDGSVYLAASDPVPVYE